MIINKETLKYLSGLARINIAPEKEEKMLGDLERILQYFEELKSVNTEGVEPATGGTALKNIFRKDIEEATKLSNEAAVKAFPKRTEEGYNKVPAVFE